jgi:hypothetical protein
MPAIYAVLLFFPMRRLFEIAVSVISDAASKFGRADRRGMP